MEELSSCFRRYNQLQIEPTPRTPPQPPQVALQHHRDRQGQDELFVLAGDDTSSRSGLDLGAMCEHLAAKLVYVTLLADEDHVPRFRIGGVNEHPERLDEIVSEIAMARSTFDA